MEILRPSCNQYKYVPFTYILYIQWKHRGQIVSGTNIYTVYTMETSGPQCIRYQYIYGIYNGNIVATLYPVPICILYIQWKHRGHIVSGTNIYTVYIMETSGPHCIRYQYIQRKHWSHSLPDSNRYYGTMQPHSNRFQYAMEQGSYTTKTHPWPWSHRCASVSDLYRLQKYASGVFHEI